MPSLGTSKVVSLGAPTRRRLLSSLRSRAWKRGLFIEVDNDWLSDTHERCRVTIYETGEIIAGGPGYKIALEDVAAVLDRLACRWFDTGRPVVTSAAA